MSQNSINHKIKLALYKTLQNKVAKVLHRRHHGLNTDNE